MPEAELQENPFPETTRNRRRKSSARASGGCRRIAIAALFLAGAVTPAVGAEAPCDAAFVQKVQESYRALRAFSASFRQEDHRLNAAAAFDPEWVRRHGSPERAVGAHLELAGMPRLPDRVYRGWRGTPPLTRRLSSLGEERLFLVGDAAGYVEPFTGEGMAWAIRGGRAVVPFVEQAVNGWAPNLAGEWSETLRRLVIRRQRLCRVFARMLRHPMLARGAIRIVAAIPAIGRAVIRRLNKGCRDEFFDSGAGHGRAA